MIIQLKEQEINILRNTQRDREQELIEQVSNLNKQLNSVSQKKTQLQNQVKFLTEETQRLEGKIARMETEMKSYEQ